jgi:hypothetical protein
MLDVHPPEHAAHTWKELFIHIATLWVGMFIELRCPTSFGTPVVP